MIDTESNAKIKETTKLYVRYSVSTRCTKVIKDELKKLGITYSLLPYGGIEFDDKVTYQEINTFRGNLQKSGLDLLDVYESKLVDRIITTIIEVVHGFDELPKLTYSEIIVNNLGESSVHYSKIFSDVVGMSIIQFIVLQKVDRIKELLLYEDIPLSEITTMLKYKNLEYLVAQFKKHTGLSPAYFKDLKNERMEIAAKTHKIATQNNQPARSTYQANPTPGTLWL